MTNSYKNLKTIRFEDELLPHWAQLLDFAARISPVAPGVSQWFSRFTMHSGVEDARTIIDTCTQLRDSLVRHRPSVEVELERYLPSEQPAQIVPAWIYSLETMILAARSAKTCSWIVEGQEDAGPDDAAGGDITLRRV